MLLQCLAPVIRVFFFVPQIYSSVWRYKQDSCNSLICDNSALSLNSFTLEIKWICISQNRKHITTIKLWLKRIRINALFIRRIYGLYEWTSFNNVIFWDTSYHISTCSYGCLFFMLLKYQVYQFHQCETQVQSITELNVWADDREC